MAIDNDIVIKSISNYVYQALVVIKRDRPEWLNDKVRDYVWEDRNFQIQFTSKLISKLGQADDRDGTIEKLISLLQGLLSPAFFVSIHFTNLITQIRKYTHPDLAREAQFYNDAFELFLEDDRSHNNGKIADESFAILLLDAENLSIDFKLEQILTSVCKYPLKVKFAFANWRSLGKKDWDFHGRGYELIHVPQGKNSADLKMISFGASLPFYYPNAKEVFVCSSDTDLNPLSTNLQEANLIVYRVYRRVDRLFIFNSYNKQTQTFSLAAVQQIPLLEEFIDRVKDIVRSHQKRTNKNWIDLDTISSSYQIKYDLPVDRVVEHYFPEGELIDFFDSLKTDFVVHQLGNKKIYISLFEMDLVAKDNKITDNSQTLAKKPERVTSNTIEENKTNKTSKKKTSKTNTKYPAKLDNSLALETAILKIINSLTATSQQEFITINNVAKQFHQLYHIPVNRAIKDLKLSGSFLKFLLQKTEQLKLKKIDNTYYVSAEKEK